MKLIKLTRSQRSPETFYAEFEDGARLRVTVALIADFSLFTGRELEADDYASLQSAAAASSAKARALRILGQRSMSRRQITERLIQKGETADAAEATADWLDTIGAVNDPEYAASIVRHYAARGYGKMRITDELYRRGIDKELWDEALCQLPDMEEKAYDFLISKLKGTQPDPKAFKRATDAMYRRGFSWDEIKSATTRYKSEQDDLFTSEEEFLYND